MMKAELEHTNLTVSDAEATAAWMQEVFGWRIRWSGPAINGGHTIHIGTEDHYLAIFQPAVAQLATATSYETIGGLNHLAFIVDDLDAAEAAVKAAGFTPGNHADYEPGRRFYFRDHDNIEYELVQYDR
jgi:catechol 2,3-dioxygenase-like lactoylglutathione lyase family enzyme